MTNILSMRLGDLAPKTQGGLFCTGICSAFGLVVIILFGPVSVLQMTRLHFGLVKNSWTGVVDLDNPLEPGRYYLGFWKELVQFPSTLNTIEFSDEQPEAGVEHLSVLRTRDKDGKRIYMDISVQYRLNLPALGTLYGEMLTLYEEVYISELRDALSKAGNLFAVQEAWENYDKVNDIMMLACIEALTKRHAQCWGLQLWGIRLESRYEAALIRTQVRKQAQRTEENRKAHSVVRAETQVLLAEYRKNKTIIESDGEAQRYLIVETASANAEKALIEVQAASLEIVQRIVSVNKTGTNMTEAQLIEYQKFIMLQKQTRANFIVNSGLEMAAVDAKSYKDLTLTGLSSQEAVGTGLQEL